LASSAPEGPPGRLGHGVRVGVDTDNETARLSRGPGEHRPTITGSDVDDHPVSAGDLLVDLADVDLEDPPADNLSHAGQSTGTALAPHLRSPTRKGRAGRIMSLPPATLES